MGGQSALVRWLGRNLRSFVSRGSAVACCRSEPAAFEGYGAGDDLLHAAELLLRWWHVGHVVDRLDLEQHCMGCARKEKPAGSANLQGGSGELEAAKCNDVEYASTT